MPDPIACPLLAAVAGACTRHAHLDPTDEVRLVRAHGHIIRATSPLGSELMKHGWTPAQPSPPAETAAVLARAAVRLEHTNQPAHLARWS